MTNSVGHCEDGMNTDYRELSQQVAIPPTVSSALVREPINGDEIIPRCHPLSPISDVGDKFAEEIKAMGSEAQPLKGASDPLPFVDPISLRDELLPMVRTRGQMRMLLDEDPPPKKRYGLEEDEPRKRKNTTSVAASRNTIQSDHQEVLNSKATIPEDSESSSDESTSLSEFSTPSSPSNSHLFDDGTPAPTNGPVGVDHRYDPSALVLTDGDYYVPKACKLYAIQGPN
jgi:hypothetical protein